MKRRALLDVNVLVALFDPVHVHHEAAHEWFARARPAGWATCPFTESALVRILSSSSYATVVQRAADVADRLRAFVASGDHAFWPTAPSITDERGFDLRRISGHRQISDAFLLAIALANHGVLATFDRAIPWRAVRSAGAEHVLVIQG